MHDLAAADAASHGDGAVRVPDAGDPVVQAVLAADASEIDAPGRFDAGYRHPDGEVADPDGALEALQVAEDDVAAHRDHVASAVAHRLEAFRVLQPERRGQRLPHEGYGKLFHRPAAADAEIVSAVHAAADRDLAVRVEGQGSMLPVHTFQQYRAFTLRQKTGGHRLIHSLAVGIDVG